jgi:polysaccharide biosynthesis transport protein
MDGREHLAGAERSESFVDASRLMRELGQRKRAIIVPTALAAALGYFFVSVVPPRYTGVAKVLLENQESYLTRPDKGLSDGGLTIDDEALQSAAEGLATAEIARKAIESLGVANRPEFHPSGLEALVSMLVGTSRPSVGDTVVDSFLNHTTVFPIARSRVVQIEFSSRDPVLAARAANELSGLFLDSRADAKQAEAKAAGDWLASRIDPLRAKVGEAEQALEAFRSSSGLLSGANGLTNPAQRLSELTTQMAAARAQQSAARAKADALREMVRAGRLDGVAEATQNESLRRYSEARVALKAQISELSRTFGPEHPRMREAAGQLAGLEDEIKLAAAKSVRGYEEEAQIASDQVRNLDAEIAEQTKIVSSGDGDTVKLRALELEARTAREQLESYLAKYREAEARESDAAGPPNARIIETANPPSLPSFPKATATILLTALAGFVLSLGVASARALLSDDAAEERSATRRAPREAFIRDAPPAPAPAAAISPPIEARADETEAAELEALASPPAEAVEAETDIETAIGRLLEETGPPPFLLLVTGEGSRGALPAALVAARRLAGRSSAALVDLGLTQPWLCDVVERDALPAESSLPGLSDLIAGRVGFDGVLHRDLSSRLDITLPGSEPIETEDLDTILAAVSENYDFVIVHASDWREEPGRVAMRRADAAILCGSAKKLGPMRERLQWERGEKPLKVAELEISKSSAIEQAA